MLSFILILLSVVFVQPVTLIFSYSSGVEEIARLTLQESHSFSVLLYAAPALTLRCRQIEELNACWNGVLRKNVGYSSSESVKQIIHGLCYIEC